MNTRTLLLYPALMCSALRIGAQDIPTDVIGDTGWILKGLDTLTLVRAADGNVWLQQNLGTAQVATAYNDAAGFGDRYQWGRWDDGHGSPTSLTALASTLSPDNPLGLGTGSDRFYIGANPSDWWGGGAASDSWQGMVATTTNGIDPCAVFGGEWHLPTQADWVSAIAAEAITNTVTAFSSNLKLTAAGARDGQTGTVINAGLYGQYWSSTPSGAYAKDLTVGDTWVNPDDDAYRGYGMCVRCMNSFLHASVGEQMHDRDARIFPNPSKGIFMVDNGATLINTVTVHAADMRTICALTPRTTSTTISLEDFPAGLYWIRIGSTEGTSWRMVVIER